MGLDGVELNFAIEEEFGIEIADSILFRVHHPSGAGEGLAQFG